ncbi:RNA polymerase sigma factor [Clostridium algidicarnis]|uniref:RNA polymerase sigma factor n=1 Tax=Clostridium algidicarnis TaxID=37659 RepID=UPI001C0BB761|nr:RNA polymerase sigma factor [Clostridium algidicarnis]
MYNILTIKKKEVLIIEDCNLIRKIQKHDKEAFDTLVRKYYQSIYSYCVRRTGDKVIAADLTQDIFLKLVKSIYDYHFIGKFSNFLFTIAVNTCTDYYRKPQRYYVDIDSLQASDEKPTPIEEVILDEEGKLIKKMIDNLPDIQKDAIILYYYHDMKAKDIAKIMGVKLSTIKSRLKQGKDKLEKSFKEEGYFER